MNDSTCKIPKKEIYINKLNSPVLFCFYGNGARFSKMITSGLSLLAVHTVSMAHQGPAGQGAPHQPGEVPHRPQTEQGQATVERAARLLNGGNKMPHRTTLTQILWATTSSFHFWNPFLGVGSCLSSHTDFPSPPSPVLPHIQLPVWQPKHWWESALREAPFHPTHMHLALFLCPASDTSTLYTWGIFTTAFLPLHFISLPHNPVIYDFIGKWSIFPYLIKPLVV